jgi:hypothetical protein
LFRLLRGADGASHCEERTYDDDRVRMSLFSTANGTCCRVLREPLDLYAMGSEQSYSAPVGVAVSCGQFNGFNRGSDILIENQYIEPILQDELVKAWD